MENDNPISQEALSLTALAYEYCNVVASASVEEPQAWLRDIVRYLPRIFIMLSDLKPYGTDTDDYDSLNTEAISGQLSEDDYETARRAMAALLGSYDTYLDTSEEDMHYSDTPVAVDLSMQLADIFQAMVDFVAAMKLSISADTDDIMAEMKYRFHAYLSDTICSALRAANNIHQSKVLTDK